MLPHSRRAALLLGLGLVVALSLLSPSAAQAPAQPQCHTFQSLNEPTPSPWLTRCGSNKYKANSCCTTSAAKRAYNWVWEDDGCGIVGPVCALALSELACAVNCSPDLVVSGFNYHSDRPVLPGKVVVSDSFSKKLFSACQGYAWCGTQQQTSTDCAFLAVTTRAQGKHTSTSLAIKSAPDTCTLVVDLNPRSFAENILGLVVAQPHEEAIGMFSDVTGVPYYPISAADAAGRPAALVLAAMLCALAALQRWL